MATGPLRFRTPHIEEIPTVHSRQAPGFAWVAVSGPQHDPAKNWETTSRKRARVSLGGYTEQQRETVTAKQQKEIEQRIRELNNDHSNKDVAIPRPKKDSAGGGAAKAGKTLNTKKILSSGKMFAHYLDDEEAEIARTGRRDGNLEVPVSTQRASKTPMARRRAGREEGSMSASPAPSATTMAPPPLPEGNSSTATGEAMDVDGDEADGDEVIAPLPSAAEIEALLSVPPLTYNQARAAPPSPGAPPRRRFCETCGYWGRVRCMKCGAMVCSVVCKDDHDQFKCLKMYS